MNKVDIVKALKSASFLVDTNGKPIAVHNNTSKKISLSPTGNWDKSWSKTRCLYCYLACLSRSISSSNNCSRSSAKANFFNSFCL